MSTVEALKPSPLQVTRRGVLLTLALAGSAAAAVYLTPHLREVEDAPDLNKSVPPVIGSWRELPNPMQQVALNTGGEATIDQPYDQTVMRSYVNDRGNIIHLALAWGRKQRQEIKIHKPEFCYRAQGYTVSHIERVKLPIHSPKTGEEVTAIRLNTQDRNGIAEVVSYWIRIGEIYSPGGLDTRVHILRQGLLGKIPDGILVRVSQRVDREADPVAAYQLQEKFLGELLAAVPAATRTLLLN
ncbi:MAG: EpsI family protein [Rubrivivax sp.]|nr:MAG: EpsI family protein [Rubrivivax sp.]